MKAAILGIGTELTDGQIVNKNAVWISKRLKALGLTTAAHLVVPDEHDLMMDGIEFCAGRADIIFITGGLGPTTDDFTRDVVAEWAGKSLHFDPASWEHLTNRLTSRGYTVKEIQRQQCFFPEGAKVLVNREGTANAFYLEVQGKKVFVLPGPPREIEAVWEDSISSWLDKETEHLDPFITRIWDTLGLGESDVATIVEDVLKGVDVLKGYRVHLPYVEVKLSFHRSLESKMQKVVDQLTEALASVTICRDGEDAAMTFAKSLQGVSSVAIIDSVTGQFLMNRLQPELRKFMNERQWTFTNSANEITSADLVLELLPIDANTVQATFDYRGKVRKDRLTSPYKTTNMKERRQQYMAEQALIFWLRQLK